MPWFMIWRQKLGSSKDHFWNLRVSLPRGCQYFLEYLLEFKNILGDYSRGQALSIHAKNQTSKISCYSPFNSLFCAVLLTLLLWSLLFFLTAPLFSAVFITPFYILCSSSYPHFCSMQFFSPPSMFYAVLLTPYAVLLTPFSVLCSSFYSLLCSLSLYLPLSLFSVVLLTSFTVLCCFSFLPLFSLLFF